MNPLRTDDYLIRRRMRYHSVTVGRHFDRIYKLIYTILLQIGKYKKKQDPPLK